MSPDDITAEWLSSILGGEVRSVTYRRIGDGHVGTCIRLNVGTDDPALPTSLVAKLPAEDERSLLLALMLKTYEREVNFYRELASTIDIRVPHCYHAEWNATTNDFVLLLEDMAPAEQGDQIAGCSFERAEAAVRAVAGLHGPRWNDPTLADIAWLGGNDSDATSDSYTAMWSMTFPGFASTYERYLSTEMLDVAERFGHRIVDFVDGRAAPRSLVHTDYRLDNLLFATPSGGAPVTVVDWQSPTRGTPLTDVSCFCGAGLLTDDRRRHERELVDAYADALSGYSIDVDDGWLWEQYRREAFHGLIVTVLTSQMVTMNTRSLDMFGAMASRHLQHAIDLDSLSLV